MDLNCNSQLQIISKVKNYGDKFPVLLMMFYQYYHIQLRNDNGYSLTCKLVLFLILMNEQSW